MTTAATRSVVDAGLSVSPRKRRIVFLLADDSSFDRQSKISPDLRSCGEALRYSFTKGKLYRRRRDSCSSSSLWNSTSFILSNFNCSACSTSSRRRSISYSSSISFIVDVSSSLYIANRDCFGIVVRREESEAEEEPPPLISFIQLEGVYTSCEREEGSSIICK